MTTKQALDFLRKSQWTQGMKQELVQLWNDERSNMRKITIYDVSTPCRLRGIRDSLLFYFQEKEKTSKTTQK